MTAPTLASLAADLAAGRTTSRALVEACLARIEDPAGEGKRAFVSVNREKALLAADAQDALRKAGAAPSPYAGIPVAIKDLFDISGEVTTAGSKVLADQPAATADGTAVARLKAAGFVIIGRSNMVEFAYSGLGLNPHYGTPKSPWKREEGHVPGGSTSGGAVAVADGMAHVALGTDTGGSCRIPAAFCGITGYKPTARRVPQDGCVPLSQSLDSIGPLANSVECCAIVDAILAAEPVSPLVPADVAGLRFLVPTTVAMDGLDPEVQAAFASAVKTLEAAGAQVTIGPVPEFAEIAVINAKGGFTASESYAWHRKLLAEKEAGYDPRVSVRIKRGHEQEAADYLDALAARRSLIARAAARIAPYDALLMPTTAGLPPAIAPLETDDAAFATANLRALRNPTLINMIDGCAISLPIPTEDGAPVGLMLAAAGGMDARLFAIAAGVEAQFRG
ncbi:amidase [Azorhizobium oxalatiphilum]|uniref:Amidase n=1 Tax=Azorhizobium oxalatiphilum TaxID=980631 RepID=A0A917BZJ9_9HYPH|nr:amidase [Azorhizobium oxalatiphilum]GGF65139.1 amidase [Azorhizobium oxalatiphilum]